ncbi:MAG: hypothetical protein ABI693_34210 [Bryobacteraceae bacterium]
MTNGLEMTEALAGHGVSVNGEGKRITLDFPNLQAAFEMLKPWAAQSKRVEMADRLHEALKAVGLSLEVKIQGRSMAELGSAARGGILLRFLGLE